MKVTSEQLFGKETTLLLDRREELREGITQLGKTTDDLVTFYNALRGLLLELKALDDERVKAFFEKYKVSVL